MTTAWSPDIEVRSLDTDGKARRMLRAGVSCVLGACQHHFLVR